eukprot:TRINITY_DN63100_c0_g1_i1.p1 TRINITY_DN63100_c0_g1~~TRINITY_DN63100_c0_g1_i1.p1  ORF type:complete len:614 (-),score=107.47 TRINITY_DN63100_c0_g1_i1:29-1819(-)
MDLGALLSWSSKDFLQSRQKIQGLLAPAAEDFVQSFKAGLLELSDSLVNSGLGDCSGGYGLGLGLGFGACGSVEADSKDEDDEPEVVEVRTHFLNGPRATSLAWLEKVIPRSIVTQLEHQLFAAKCGHVLFPSLANFISGYDGAVTSFAVMQLMDPDLIGAGFTAMSALDVGAVVSSRVCGALGGSLVVLCTRQEPSSRDLLLYSALGLSVVSGYTCAASSWHQLVLLRFVSGFLEGVSSPAKVAYTTETVQAELRAAASGVRLGCFAGGATAGVLLGAALRLVPGAWHVMLGAAAVPSVAMSWGIWTLPQSPRWLMHNGPGADAASRKIAAIAALQALRLDGLTSAAQELESMYPDDPEERSCLPDAGGQPGRHSCEERLQFLTSPATQISTAVMFFKQAGGCVAITTYLAPILAGLGFQEHFTSLGIVLMVVRGVSTPAGVILMDRLGRRGCLLLGTLGGAASMGGLMVTHLLGPVAPQSMLLASFGCLAASTGLFELGLASTPFTLSSELYRQPHRQHGLALAHVCNYAVKAIGVQSFPLVLSYGGLLPLWTMFALVNGVGFVVVYRIVPETAGRNLEDVARELDAGPPLRWL